MRFRETCARTLILWIPLLPLGMQLKGAMWITQFLLRDVYEAKPPLSIFGSGQMQSRKALCGFPVKSLRLRRVDLRLDLQSDAEVSFGDRPLPRHVFARLDLQGQAEGIHCLAVAEIGRLRRSRTAGVLVQAHPKIALRLSPLLRPFRLRVDLERQAQSLDGFHVEAERILGGEILRLSPQDTAELRLRRGPLRRRLPARPHLQCEAKSFSRLAIQLARLLREEARRLVLQRDPEIILRRCPLPRHLLARADFRGQAIRLHGFAIKPSRFRGRAVRLFMQRRAQIVLCRRPLSWGSFAPLHLQSEPICLHRLPVEFSSFCRRCAARLFMKSQAELVLSRRPLFGRLFSRDVHARRYRISRAHPEKEHQKPCHAAALIAMLHSPVCVKKAGNRLFRLRQPIPSAIFPNVMILRALAATLFLPAILLAQAASSDPDLAFQGEYSGPYAGGQVIAMGEGKFEISGWKSGLPGENAEVEFVGRVPAVREGEKVVFTTEAWKGHVTNGELTASSPESETYTLKKTERKSPTLGAKPPEGATVLFDGSNADAWAGGQLENGLLKMGAKSKQSFGACTLHLEFMTGFQPTARGKARGNSGVYLQDRYEVQILDSFGLDPENTGCGAIYGIAKPLVNMCFPPLTWQTFDIDFEPAQYDSAGAKTANARLTVKHNGVLIHDRVEVPKATNAAGRAEGAEPGPIHLQDHGNPVHFRNIWVVEKK